MFVAAVEVVAAVVFVVLEDKLRLHQLRYHLDRFVLLVLAELVDILDLHQLLNHQDKFESVAVVVVVAEY